MVSAFDTSRWTDMKLPPVGRPRRIVPGVHGSVSPFGIKQSGLCSGARTRKLPSWHS
jgi:hypothetical protein